MKSGSIGFAAKSTSRDIGSPPKSSARPTSGPGIGLYTPPLFDLSGFISSLLQRPAGLPWRTEKTRNVFRLRPRSRLRAKEPGPTDPRGPRSASAKARPPRAPDFRALHVGPGVGPAGGGLRGRHRAAGILHAVGQ